jgi:hypothetical protein
MKRKEPPNDDRLDQAHQKMMLKLLEQESWENQHFPNIAYVRSKIANMRDPDKKFDALQKLSQMMNQDGHEHIQWPLPSWKAIRNRSWL